MFQTEKKNESKKRASEVREKEGQRERGERERETEEKEGKRNGYEDVVPIYVYRTMTRQYTHVVVPTA